VTLRRVTGEAAFAADFVRPETLHLAIRRSPLAHGRVLAADTSDARAVAGVVTALTAEEAGGLLDPVLRFVGDRAAVVAAEDPEIARRAAELIHLVVKPLPAALDAEAASRDPERVAARLDIQLGDVDAALAEADHVVEGTWSFPFSPAMTLEPPVALTWLDEDRRLVVRTSAESPFRVRGLLADRLGLPAARIRVVRPLVAGSAQGRADLPIEDLCGLVTLRTGRPARLTLSAQEELTIAPGRPPQQVAVRLGLRDGRISGLALRVLVDVGGGTDGAPELLSSASRQALALYGTASLRLEALAVRTNRPPMSARHGADDDTAIALECAVAEAARHLEEDGVAVRHRLLRRGASREAPGGLSEALGEAPGADDTLPTAEVLRTGAEQVGWKSRLLEPTLMDPVRRGRGVGLARRSPGTVGGTGAAASLRLLEDGSFALAAAPSSAAGADETAFVAAAADLLGVPTRRIVLAGADTDSAPFEAGDLAPTFSSAGRAVEEAARLACERIREAGAALLEVDPGAVELVAGEVRAPDDRRVGFAAIGAGALRAGQPLVATAAPSADSTPPSDAAVFAELEVDTETGVTRPLHLTAVLAGGPFADPRPAEAQVHGALAAAIERALAAGLAFDADGVPLAPSLLSWPLVAAGDLPPMKVVFVPTGEPSTRFGTVAIGEAAGRAAVAAIAGAIADATGATVRSLPLDPSTVLGLCPEL
jgi:putative selenate reductase molybdopterin-binding subunit